MLLTWWQWILVMASGIAVSAVIGVACELLGNIPHRKKEEHDRDDP